MISVGFDTSNYTTSCAWFDGTAGENHSRLLDVKPGQLGLRQSEALFSHIKRLPELSDRLFACLDPKMIASVGVSTRPRAVEGSYMPCFLAGECQARTLAAALHVPLYAFSHQQGHIAAALYGAGRMDLIGTPLLAWHLSGGTTELLDVRWEGSLPVCDPIGGTTDISAGQLIDRTGQLLGLDFPAGRALDALSTEGQSGDFFKVRVTDAGFSLSGVQNQVEQFYARTGDRAATARFALGSVCWAVRRATLAALERFPGRPVLCSGGVASNSMLRAGLAALGPVFAPPAFSTDNAMGIAVLARLQEV